MREPGFYWVRPLHWEYDTPGQFLESSRTWWIEWTTYLEDEISVLCKIPSAEEIEKLWDVAREANNLREAERCGLRNEADTHLLDEALAALGTIPEKERMTEPLKRPDVARLLRLFPRSDREQTIAYIEALEEIARAAKEYVGASLPLGIGSEKWLLEALSKVVIPEGGK
jgi:hypothetical protein